MLTLRCDNCLLLQIGHAGGGLPGEDEGGGGRRRSGARRGALNSPLYSMLCYSTGTASNSVVSLVCFLICI